MRFVKISEIDIETGIANPIYVNLDDIEYIREHYDGFFDGDGYKNYTEIGMHCGVKFTILQDAKKLFSLAKEDKERTLQKKNEYNRF